MDAVDLPTAGTMTFLFTDLEGSTRLWERDPDAMKDALRRHDAILRSAVEGSAGQVVKTTGDGMMAVFGRAFDAVSAALVAQRDLTAQRWPTTVPLRARVGIHAGTADERTGDYFGPAVNRTARIMAVGHGGQVLLSASAAALVGERLPEDAGLKDLGEHRLKDLGRPEHLFQLVHPDLLSDFPPLAAAQGAARLPSMTAAMIGRTVELDGIERLLADPAVRLVTLTGAGGTGKTAIAIRVAENLAAERGAGMVFVDVSSARDTNLVLVAIARAVGLGEVVDGPLDVALQAWLRDRRLLLILDNLEQVTQAAGAVAGLLRECPQLTVLATSRESLHVRAEHVYPIPPLAVPPTGSRRVTAQQIEACDAVRLFVDRARAVRPDFALTDENATAVAEICRRLDGLPLAIELAAARLRLFSPEVLRDRLDDRLGLLRSGPRDLPERQQTLRAAMDWSYNLLEPAEQRLFEFLAVFAGADVGEIEAVATSVRTIRDLEIDLLDGLVGLIEKSLARQVGAPGQEPRVTMLETIREFAADRLNSQPGFAAEARRAHAIHYADLARRLRPDLMGPARETALAAMVADLANLRIAWRYWVGERDLEQLEKLADSLLIVNDAGGWYLDTVGLATDMLAVLESASAAPDRIGQEIAFRTTLARALMATRGFTQEVEDALTGALDLFERGGDVRQQFSVLRGLASLYQFRAQFDKALGLGREILALGERERDRRIQIDGHLVVGSTMAFGSDLLGGLAHLDEAIAMFEAGRGRPNRVGNDPRIACLTTSGFTLWLLGSPDRALARMGAALSLAAELQHPITSAYANFHAGLLHFWRREPELALERAGQVLDIADEHELAIWAAVGRCLHGAASVALGRTEDGLSALRDGLEQYQGRRSPPVFWPMLLFLGAGASLGAGRPADGLEPLETATRMMSVGSGASVLPEFLLLKGDLLAALATGVPGGSPDDVASPGHWYRLALDRAILLGARMSQLRAAVRLATLSQAAGEPEAGANLLGPVLAGFAEGSGTADLVEARALLAAVTGAG
jgi:predicted ATPase/class 3 adenylate cyclase